jgi:glycosyl hydrolase family 25
LRAVRLEINAFTDDDSMARRGLGGRLVSNLAVEDEPMSEAGTITLGIDVSKWQSKIDWQKVVDGTAYKFAFIKATENVGHVDKRFAENWRGAREAVSSGSSSKCIGPVLVLYRGPALR